MNKVENFRLNKDQSNFMKEVKKINQIESIIAKGALQEWFKKGESLRRIFEDLNEKRKALNMIAPKEKIDEIPGQEEEEMDFFEDRGEESQAQGLITEEFVR